MTSVEKNILSFPKRKDRSITVDNVKWKWKCGKGGGVVAYSEHGERLQANAATVNGIDQATFERGQYQRTSDGALKPKDVSNWIRITSKDKTMEYNALIKSEALIFSRKNKNTMFFTFMQNNSHGIDIEKPENGIGSFVIIEAHDAIEANERAIKIGLYFDGRRSGKDCSCCGDRWTSTHDCMATKKPEIYNEVIRVKRPKEVSVYSKDANTFVHFLNGLFVGVK